MLNRIYLYAATMLAVVGAGVRTLLLAIGVDEKSGFYKPQYATLGSALGITALVLLAGFLIWGRVAFKPKTAVAFPQKNQPLAVGALLVAITAVIQGVCDYSAVTEGNLGLLAFVCCFATALGYGVIGMSLWMEKPIPFITTALPIVGQLIYLILQYANFNGVATIPEGTIWVLAIASFLALTMSQCRIISGVDSPKGVAFGYGTAAVTAFFGLCSSVPYWVAGNNQYPLTYIGFGAAVYALVYLFALPTLAKKQDHTDVGIIEESSTEEE